MVRRPPQGERTWQGTENALAALREAGLDDATAAATYQGLLNDTLGHAALEAPYALMRFDVLGWRMCGPTKGRPAVRLAPVKPGLTFHGLRHGHKTWMIADAVPEVAQSRRLGHILGDRIRETYSHVAAEVETRLLDGLQDRWLKAVADSPLAPDWWA